jgi:predicted GH43/DUF377 family glycosyl hydrolase
MPGLAVRTGIRLQPDRSRVVTRLFVAGIELEGGGESRASNVVTRVLDLDEAEVTAYAAELRQTFGDRHPDLHHTYNHHADRIANRIEAGASLSADRKYVLGAMFTHEYAIEAAALCNPSVVPHPDQRGCEPGSLRFLMSVRGIGEGHRSSIGFRSGVVHADRSVTMDPVDEVARVATVDASMLDRAVFRRVLRDEGHDDENTSFVLDHLGERFGIESLRARLDELAAQSDTRRFVDVTIARMNHIADSTYAACFGPEVPLSSRVLWPHSAAEHRGMEDARFVRFHDENRSTYYGTYTAYDGVQVRQHLIETEDFLEFAMSPLTGAAASNKGLAIFPRRIGGRFYALSRADRETNAVAVTDDVGCWQDSAVLQTPARGWEAVQLGNCGSPIETDDGWLVLTHAVGAMRTYSIGAMLVDLDEPTKVIKSLHSPLLAPSTDERDGYVPNVVYSCGALVHEGLLVLPYGVADQSISIATVSMDDLLAAMS